MRLDVPDYEQGLNECGPNALRMVYEYYGMSGAFDIHDNYFLGTSIRDFEEYSQEHGMKAGIVNNSNIDAIKQYIDQDMPVILIGKDLNSGADHYIVVAGYEEQADGSLSFYVNDGDGETGELYSQQELETFWGDNYIPGSSNLMLVIAPENSTQAGYVPETKLDEDTTTTNLLESLNDIVYVAAETYWPFDTNADFIGVDDWMNNIWDGHADGLGGFTSLPLQGAASALDDVGGWIGGDVGNFTQGIANDISEAGYNLQDTVGTFIQDPIGTAEEFVSDTMDEVENLVSDPIGTISSWF